MSATDRKLAATWEPDSESAVVAIGASLYVLRVWSVSNNNGTTWSCSISTGSGESRGHKDNLPTRRAAKTFALQHLGDLS